MKNSKLHTLIYDWILPFLTMLQGKGISVTPDTHIQLMKVLEVYADEITSENIIDTISPVVVKSPEQRAILNEVWASFLLDQFPAPETEGSVKPGRIDGPGIEPPPRSFWKYLVGGLALVVVAAAAFFIFRPVEVPVLDASAGWVGRNVKDSFLFVLRTAGYASHAKELKVIWDFGDGSKDSSGPVVRFQYRRPGTYKWSVQLIALSPTVRIGRAKMDTTLNVCPVPIQIVPDRDSGYEPGQLVHCRLSYDSLYSPSGPNTWSVNNNPVKSNSLSFDTVFTQPGQYVVGFVVDSAAGVCDDEATASIVVKEPSTGLEPLIIQGSPDGLQPEVSMRRIWIWGPVALILLLLLMMLWMRRRLQKREKMSLDQLQAITEPFKGDRPPFDVPFRNHDELIDEETTLLHIAKSYNRRNPDTTYYLNIEKTIQSTIRMEGMISLVYGNRTRPVEFLVLIDRSRAKNQQVKLFEYLLAKLGRNDLSLEKYYFQSDPTVCTNLYHPKGIHLSRLHDLYPDHVLILFGTGYQLIDPYYPSLHEPLAKLFRKWEHWAICTPVNIADWNYKEAVLGQATILLPADLKGQLLLFQAIGNNRWTFSAQMPAADVYHAGTKELDDLASLEAYLGEPFLFQWVSAIAVYPRIQWDVLVAIGEELQRRNYPGRSVNYSALLKIVRIRWMQDGSFPDHLRLEMLKRLEPRNEKVARETMIRLLDEAARGVDTNVFTYEQVQMQRMANQFILYAHDPAEPAYQGYKAGSDAFKVLWEQGRIKDYALSTYLQKPAGGESWSSLLYNKTLSERPADSKGIDEYFTDSLSARRKRVRRTQWGLLGGAVGLSIILILLLIAGPRLAGGSLDRWLHFTAAEDSVAVHFGMAFNDCLDYAEMQSDSVRMEIVLPGGLRAELNARDTAITIKVPIGLEKTDTVRFSVRSLSNLYAVTGTFAFNSRQLRIGMSGCSKDSVVCKGRWVPGGKRLPAGIAGDWFGREILTGNDESYICTHIATDTFGHLPIVRTFVCSGDTHILRLIVRDNKDFATVYLRSGSQSNGIQLSASSKVYASAEEAAADHAKTVWKNYFRLPRNYDKAATEADIRPLLGAWIWSGGDTTRIERQRVITKDGNEIIQDISRNSDDFPVPVYQVRMVGISKDKKAMPLTLFMVQVRPSTLLWRLQGDWQSGPVQNEIDRSLYKFTKVSGGIGGSTANAKEAALPQSLNEIWHNNVNDRLINIDLDNRTIYYSTGSKNTYGTYTIDTAMADGVGGYRIIANAHPGYNVFQIRNVQAGAFELSFCPIRFTDRPVAIANANGNCGSFNAMTHYYDTDPSVLYVPVPGLDGDNRIYEDSAPAKALIAAAEAKMPYNDKNTYFTEFLYYHNKLLRLGKPMIMERDKSQVTMAAISPGPTEMKDAGSNPFQRDYWKVEIAQPQPGVNTQEDLAHSKVTAVNSLSKVIIGNTTQVMGFYLVDAQGNNYGVCTLPGTRDYKIGQEVKLADGNTAGTLYRVSSEYAVVGLIKLYANCKPANEYDGVKITDVRELDGRTGTAPVIMPNSNSKSGVSTGTLIGRDVLAVVIVDNVQYKLQGLITVANIMAHGTAGSVLLDKDNYALGILISGNAVSTNFIPLPTLIKEFNLRPLP